jgi:asparagine synthase (glutamine-hydrolysing)
LDSSTIASLAAERADLVGCLYHDAHTSIADLDGAKQVAAERSRIDLRVTIGDLSTVHYTGLDGDLPLPVTDRPAGSISMRAMDRAYLAPAVRAGCTDHLIGVGGDEILDPDRAWWVDLRDVVGVRETRRRITSWAHQRKTAPGPVVVAVETFAATTRAAGLAALALALQRGSAATSGSGLAWAWPSRAVPWLTRHGRETLAEFVREEAQRPWTDTPGETAQGLALRSGGRSVVALTDLHGAHGLRVHAPFLDNLVVRAALAVPGWERRDPHVFKPLLGLAMRGRVPDVVLNRRSKGTMTPTMLRGIRRNLPTLRSLVLDGMLADSGLLNPHTIAAELQRAADGNGRAPLAALNQAIALEVWTNSVDTTASTWWEESTP